MLTIAGGGRAASPTSFRLPRLPSNYNLRASLPARARRCGPGVKQFRSGFLGKASPVNFFWGSFDGGYLLSG
jgi:hypothetical protein